MKFVHIFETSKKKTRGITVAYESTFRGCGDAFNPSFYDVLCGVSYCAPIEQNYSRPLGRKISTNRLSCKKCLANNFRFSMAVSSIDLDGVGMEYLVVSKLKTLLLPEWAKSLVERRLSGYSATEETDVVQE